MIRFMTISFLFLGFVFYELSGGRDFDPLQARAESMQARADLKSVLYEQRTGNERMALVTPTMTPEPETVTRVSLNLSRLSDVMPEEPTALQDADLSQLQPIQASLVQTEEPADNIVLPSIIFAGSTTASAPIAEPASADIRSVSGSRVNLRGGPGTNFAVLASLTEGTEVEVIDEPGNGWVQLRTLDGNTVGWTADFLLTAG